MGMRQIVWHKGSEVVEKEFELNDDCPFRVKIPNTEGHRSILHLQQCSMWYIELEGRGGS